MRQQFNPAHGSSATVRLRDRQSRILEAVYPRQLSLVKPAEETIGVRGQLFSILETLPEDKLAQVKDLAEFLKSKSAIA